MGQAIDILGTDYVSSVLLACCAASFLAVVLSLLAVIWLLRKNAELDMRNASLVELLLSDSKRHTNVILSLSERLNYQYYTHQEKVSIEHIANLRELLSSLSVATSKRPDKPLKPEE